MTVSHRLTGFDKKTERLALSHDIPRSKEQLARQVVEAAPDDPELIFVYPLTDTQVRRIARAIGKDLNIDRYDWFLEPMPQPIDAPQEAVAHVE